LLIFLYMNFKLNPSTEKEEGVLGFRVIATQNYTYPFSAPHSV
jgi:hypothetical protein